MSEGKGDDKGNNPNAESMKLNTTNNLINARGDNVPSTDGVGIINPLNILPPEMWDATLKQLDDPIDVANVTRTCVLFEDLLMIEKGACELDAMLPLLFKWLPETDVFTLRCTCNRIRNVTDKILNESGRVFRHTGMNMFPRLVPPSQQEQISVPGAVSHEWRLFGNGILDNFSVQLGPHPDKLESFWRDMEPIARQPTGNPFICKKLYLTFHDRARIQRIQQHRFAAILADVAFNVNEPFPVVDSNFLERTLQMLTLFSSKLHTLKLRLPFDDVGVVQLYDMFRRVCLAVKDDLRCMVALFKLALHDPSFADTNEWNAMAEAQMTRLTSHIQENPLPVMKQLDELHLPCSLNHAPISQELMGRYSHQLRSLRLGLQFYNEPLEVLFEVDDEPPNVYRSIEPNAYAFPLLRHLRLQMSWFVHEKMWSRIEAPKLTQLWIHLQNHNGFCSIAPETKVKEVIFKFPSIVSLHLEKLEFTREPAVAATGSEQPQNKVHEALRHLSFNEWNHDLPLKFFTDLFPNVETIKICIGRGWHGAFQNIGTDGTLLCDRRMYESNLWKERPALERIHFECQRRNQVDIYTRQNFLRIQKEKDDAVP